MKAKQLIDALRSQFTQELQAKTGWGRNEVLQAFERAATATLGELIELPKPLADAPPNHKLCYVSGYCAYFTNKPLAEQWGDDWNDAPYEHNAGTPYEDMPGQIFKVRFICDTLVTPDYEQSNTPWSVEQINAGAMPWLRPSPWQKECQVFIQAGCTVEEFVAAIRKAGGEVFYKPHG